MGAGRLVDNDDAGEHVIHRTSSMPRIPGDDNPWRGYRGVANANTRRARPCRGAELSWELGRYNELPHLLPDFTSSTVGYFSGPVFAEPRNSEYVLPRHRIWWNKSGSGDDLEPSVIQLIDRQNGLVALADLWQLNVGTIRVEMGNVLVDVALHRFSRRFLPQSWCCTARTPSHSGYGAHNTSPNTSPIHRSKLSPTPVTPHRLHVQQLSQKHSPGSSRRPHPPRYNGASVRGC